MATIRDDLARMGRKVLEAVEDRTGREVVPHGQTEVLESERADNRGMRKMLEWIGYQLFNYQGVQPTPYRMPTDLLPSARIFAAGQAWRTWMQDPMAGQGIDLYVSFVFGRGVPTVQAHDDEVQDLLDATWADASNQRTLTSHERLIEKGVDLAIQANVYFVFFDDGDDGQVRVSLKRFEDVLDVVRHPVDQYRILYYKVSERTLLYDYSRDSYVTPPGNDGRPTIVYYEAFDAFDDDDPVMVEQDRQAGALLQQVKPPADRLRPGKIVHLAVNKNSEMAFGVPRLARLERWLSAYNSVLESHVNRMKAMASIYMKQTAKGADQRGLDRLAQAAMGRASTFGQAAEDAGYRHVVPGPRAETGILQENESVEHTPFKIDSGASDVASSIPQLRAQVSGPFSPAYYGQDPGALAGQQAVELPTLKFIEMEQETWKGAFRRLAQARIDAAIDKGFLDEWRDPTDDEVARIEAFEQNQTPLDGLEFDPSTGKVKRDLGFEINLPSPLKRAMSDLVAAATQTATAVDPMGQNSELSRWLFGFILAEAFDVDDPQRIVDMVLPRHLASQEDEAAASAQPAPPAPGQPPAQPDNTSTGPDGQQHPPGNPYGAQQQSPNPEDRSQPVSEAAQDDRRRLVDDEFAKLVEAAEKALEHLDDADLPSVAASNGHAR